MYIMRYAESESIINFFSNSKTDLGRRALSSMQLRTANFGDLMDFASAV